MWIHYIGLSWNMRWCYGWALEKPWKTGFVGLSPRSQRASHAVGAAAMRSYLLLLSYQGWAYFPYLKVEVFSGMAFDRTWWRQREVLQLELSYSKENFPIVVNEKPSFYLFSNLGIIFQLCITMQLFKWTILWLFWDWRRHRAPNKADNCYFIVAKRQNRYLITLN